MMKSCSRCGKIHAYNFKCSANRDYSGGNERKLRSKYSWTLKSREIRERANHLCEVCKDRGVYTYDNIEVHHIEKVKDNEDGLLDDFNLICLCQAHHKEADAGKLDKDYLWELVARREDNPPCL